MGDHFGAVSGRFLPYLDTIFASTLMGGPGSGQRPSKFCVTDCRVLSIAELVAAARRHPPGGEVIWQAKDDGAVRGRLSYSIGEERRPEGTQLPVLALRYRPTPTAAESRERLILDPDKPALAHCPSCEQPLRKLYAPPGAAHFLCRACHGLVYRSARKGDELATLQAAMGGLLRGLYADYAVIERPPTAAERERALARTAYQSRGRAPPLRPGAARLVSAPGQGGPLFAGHRPPHRRLQEQRAALPGGRPSWRRPPRAQPRAPYRYDEAQLSGLAGLPLRAQAQLLGRHVRKLGLDRHSAQDLEEKLVL